MEIFRNVNEAGQIVLPPLWDRYFSSEETGALYRELELALEFQREFAAQGITLEVIYADVVHIPRDLSQYPKEDVRTRSLQGCVPTWVRMHRPPTERPEGLKSLGFDLSDPIPTFHSALYQPGLSRVAPSVRGDLNAAGLFADLGDALRWLPVALSLDYGVPFCVIEVLELDG
ncbi:MAG: hypothetical protein JXB32_08130 [Deltaproteobacteria bacterium]|nr:hypothetical protein [Deltaproteobacteria bacterium]